MNLLKNNNTCTSPLNIFKSHCLEKNYYNLTDAQKIRAYLLNNEPGKSIKNKNKKQSNTFHTFHLIQIKTTK